MLAVAATAWDVKVPWAVVGGRSRLTRKRGWPHLQNGPTFILQHTGTFGTRRVCRIHLPSLRYSSVRGNATLPCLEAIALTFPNTYFSDTYCGIAAHHPLLAFWVQKGVWRRPYTTANNWNLALSRHASQTVYRYGANDNPQPETAQQITR